MSDHRDWYTRRPRNDDTLHCECTATNLEHSAITALASPVCTDAFPSFERGSSLDAGWMIREILLTGLIEPGPMTSHRLLGVQLAKQIKLNKYTLLIAPNLKGKKMQAELSLRWR